MLLHFADSRSVSIARLTLDFPSSMTVIPYDYYLVGEAGIGIGDSRRSGRRLPLRTI